MAGFCGKCGNPLDDTQAFCARCGAPVGGQPVRPPAAASGTPPAPQYRPPAPTPSLAPPAAPASAKSGNTLVRVLLVFVVVIFVFGALGAAGIWYVAHKAKQKFHEIGLDEISSDANANRAPVLAGIDPCTFLSKAEVGQAATVEVVRAERADGTEPGCVYSVMGDTADLVAKHASLLHNESTTDAQRQQFESFSKGFFHGMNQGQGGYSSKHPGEAPVFLFTASNAAAKAQMNLIRMAFGRMGPGGMTVINGMGDEAIDIGGAMMLVRKDDKIVRVMYMMCPCTTADVTPLVKKLVTNMD
jgi:hypothetical protein